MTPPPQPSQVALLLAASRVHLDADGLANLAPLCKAVSDWPELIRTARRHKVATLLHSHLEKLESGTVPADALSALLEIRSKYRESGNRMVQDLEWLRDLFERHGIQWLTFKGPMLSTTAYGDDPSLRQVHDLDILVRKREVLKIRDLLTPHGFAPHLEPPEVTDRSRLRSTFCYDYPMFRPPPPFAHRVPLGLHALVFWLRSIAGRGVARANGCPHRSADRADPRPRRHSHPPLSLRLPPPMGASGGPGGSDRSDPIETAGLGTHGPAGRGVQGIPNRQRQSRPGPRAPRPGIAPLDHGTDPRRSRGGAPAIQRRFGATGSARGRGRAIRQAFIHDSARPRTPPRPNPLYAPPRIPRDASPGPRSHLGRLRAPPRPAVGKIRHRSLGSIDSEHRSSTQGLRNLGPARSVKRRPGP